MNQLRFKLDCPSKCLSFVWKKNADNKQMARNGHWTAIYQSQILVISLSGQKLCVLCSAHVALPKWPINQFQPVQFRKFEKMCQELAVLIYKLCLKVATKPQNCHLVLILEHIKAVLVTTAMRHPNTQGKSFSKSVFIWCLGGSFVYPLWTSRGTQNHLLSLGEADIFLVWYEL